MDARRNVPRLNRRRFLGTAAAGLGAAGIAASDAAAAPAGQARHGHDPLSLTEAVLAALRTHPLVAISDAHQGQETHDLLMTLISDPRLPGKVNDIVVEFGDAFYQDLIDRFTLGDQPVNDADLRLVWRNTTNSPLATNDAPIYEQIFRRVRAVNWTLPPAKRIRVLLGDPPLDWSKITNASQIPLDQRDTYPASLVEQQVLAKDRRALLLYGGTHLLHNNAQPTSSIVSLIEQHTGVRAHVILDLVPLQGAPGDVFTRLAAYPRGTVIPAQDTWLGQTSAGDVLPGFEELQPGGKPTLVNLWCGVTLGQLVDAGLYLGQAADLTASQPNPAIFLDPVYWAELQRRNTIHGNITDLNTYRQQQPPTYPLGPAGPPC
jgi:hypothetical protein